MVKTNRKKLAAKWKIIPVGTGRLVHDINQVNKETIQLVVIVNFLYSRRSCKGLCTVKVKLAGGDTNAALLFQCQNE